MIARAIQEISDEGPEIPAPMAGRMKTPLPTTELMVISQTDQKPKTRLSSPFPAASSSAMLFIMKMRFKKAIGYFYVVS